MMTLDEFTPFLFKAQDSAFVETRDKLETRYTDYTKKGKTNKADFRSVTGIKFGPAGYTPQGGQAHLDEYAVGTERVTKFKKLTIAVITPEELASDIYNGGRVDEDKVEYFKNISTDLADSMNWAYEIICSDFHVRCKSTTATQFWPGAGRDGLALASASHVTTKGTPVTWSNLQTAAPMSDLVLMEGVTMLENIPDETGRPLKSIKRIGVMFGRYWSWMVPQILKASGQPFTANVNTPNALKVRDQKVEFVPILNEFIPNTDTGWDLIDLDNHMLLHFMKEKGTLNRDTEPRTGNQIVRNRSRFASDFHSAKGFLHNDGA